ncbi:MAG: aminoglycoside 6-N-acetyltransferase [Chloroflexota bacterium]|nr:aminoglycoside 6-N-acetyltransferase [Chloroflexota bacterium]
MVAWWGAASAADLDDELVSDDVQLMVVEVDGETAGLISYSEIDDPMYHSASVDIALAAAHQGRGLGADSVRTLCRHLFESRGHHRITIDPAAHNLRAIKSYSAVGFRPVGVMRQYERGTDGTFHDGLLMDLLRDELLPPG